MLYIYAYCYYHNISYDGLISTKRDWWYNMIFFNYVQKFLNIKNNVIDSSGLNKITFKQINNYSNKSSQNICTEFIVADLCPYFSNNINKYINHDFKKHMNTLLEDNRLLNKKKSFPFILEEGM